jgi:hypothetical protein
MKKLLVILFSVGLTAAATAQPKIGGAFRGGSLSAGIGGGGVKGGGEVHYVRPRVTVLAPVVPISPYYGYGLGYGARLGFGYSPFYDPFYNRRFESRPTQLDLQIEDIKDEYSYKISSVKHDKSLAKDERKQKVRELKHQREQEIIDAKKSYYGAKDNGSRADS